MKRGVLIAFEGLDGSGKSTQLRRAARALRARGHDVVETREPTDGPFGQRIRAMARSGRKVAPETELAWFFEDRRDHMRAVVAPALAEGKVVLSDRSYLSTVAYQGARGLDPQRILADSEAEFIHPDLVLLFEISAEEGLARVAARGGVAEPAFEDQAFLEQVSGLFNELDVAGLVRIDASRSVEAIEQDVIAAIERQIERQPSD